MNGFEVFVHHQLTDLSAHGLTHHGGVAVVDAADTSSVYSLKVVHVRTIPGAVGLFILKVKGPVPNSASRTVATAADVMQ
jgi:hypothetical protein